MSFEIWIAIIIGIVTIVCSYFFSYWQVRTALSIADPVKYPPISESKIFKAIRKYWSFLYLIIIFIWNLINLINIVNSPDPVTRNTVLGITLLTALTLFLFYEALKKGMDFLLDWKYGQEEKKQVRIK
jgi:hypothetical protein